MQAGGDRWRSHASPICFHCFGFFSLAELFHVLRKWLRVLDFCNALSELLSLSGLCVALLLTQAGTELPEPWLVALCRYRALTALGGDRAGREQPGPPAPALSAALRASHPATELLGLLLHRYTHSLPSSSLSSACSRWHCNAGTRG